MAGLHHTRPAMGHGHACSAPARRSLLTRAASCVLRGRRQLGQWLQAPGSGCVSWLGVQPVPWVGRQPQQVTRPTLPLTGMGSGRAQAQSRTSWAPKQAPHARTQDAGPKHKGGLGACQKVTRIPHPPCEANLHAGLLSGCHGRCKPPPYPGSLKTTANGHTLASIYLLALAAHKPLPRDRRLQSSPAPSLLAADHVTAPQSPLTQDTPPSIGATAPKHRG